MPAGPRRRAATRLALYDTAARRVVALAPADGVLRMYSCGPTVYRDAHLGNLRSYLLADWIRRAAEATGLPVRHVKNITDVGHMRQEAVDRGEDKVIAAALAAGTGPAEIAARYEARFREDERRLNIQPAHVFPRATEHVPQMVRLIERLVARGLAYEVNGAVYFSVRSFPGYGRLSGNAAEALRQGVRGDLDPRKRDPADFALWKAAEPGRALTWPSPWGVGFPGWHIECSAMSLEHLGERIDLHTGGVDNIFPHHEGEIAQSDGALGRTAVGHWTHGQHLLADGVKMSKSARNEVLVDDLEGRGYDPLAFRYQALLTHYRARMDFSFGALAQAARGLAHLREAAYAYSRAGGAVDGEARVRAVAGVLGSVCDDLDLPGALALTWRVVRDETLSRATRLAVVLDADRILGLDLDRDATAAIPRTRPWRRAWPAIASPREVPDRRAEVPTRSWTVALVARGWPEDVERAVSAALRHLPADGEIIVLDLDSGAEAGARVEALGRHPAVRTIHADRNLGEGAARNALLRASRGALLLQLDASVEITGDLFGALAAALRASDVGFCGPWGLRTDDLRRYEEVTVGEVEAIAGYCLASRREVLLGAGGFDERFRFYRNLDIALSLAARALGYRHVAAGAACAVRHVHRAWEELPEAERDKRSRRNFDRMYRRFHGRSGPLASGAPRP